MGGQVYMDFLSLKQRADILFTFTAGSDGCLPEDQQRALGEDTLKEINNQLINLSSRLKEFDTKTPKKLLCSLHISKLILKYFNVFSELSSSDSDSLTRAEQRRIRQVSNDADDMLEKEEQQEAEDSDDDEARGNSNVLTKQIVDKADRLTENVPDQDVIGTMLLKKSRYMHDFLSKNRRF
jgi:hypothetical protein